MSTLHLGAQLYTLRDVCKNEVDFASTIKKVADIGYKYVQVSGVGPMPPRYIRDVCDANGIKIILTHTSAADILNKTAEVIENHKILGVQAIGIGGAPYGHGYDQYMRFCSDYAKAFEEIKAAGMIFLYHNHRVEFQRYDGVWGLDVILNNTPADSVKLTFDTYWALSGGVDPAQYIKTHADRIFCTHLKDMAVINNEPVMIEMLDGNINFDAVIAESEAAGVEWHFVEQDVVRIDLFESMKRSYDNLTARYKFD